MAPRAAKSSPSPRPAYCTVEQLTYTPPGASHVFGVGDRVDEILPPNVLEAVLANGEAAYAVDESDPEPVREQPEPVPQEPAPEPEPVPDESQPDPAPVPEPEAGE